MFPLQDDVPTQGAPVVTIALIVANVVVFLFELSVQGSNGAALNAFLAHWGVVPAQLLANAPRRDEWLTPFTSMFLHAGFLHLGGNMLYLWIFGNNIEDLLGRVRYLGFYVACGLVAVASHVASTPHSSLPVIGASGAVSGVLGAYALVYPRARVRTLVTLGIMLRTFLVPAWVFLVFWFALQVFSGAMQGRGDGDVAWWAHVGGFVAGAALVKLLQVHPPVRERTAL